MVFWLSVFGCDWIGGGGGREKQGSSFCSVRVWFSQGVLSTIVKPRNVFQTRESQNSDKSVRNRKPC